MQMSILDLCSFGKREDSCYETAQWVRVPNNLSLTGLYPHTLAHNRSSPYPNKYTQLGNKGHEWCQALFKLGFWVSPITLICPLFNKHHECLQPDRHSLCLHALNKALEGKRLSAWLFDKNLCNEQKIKFKVLSLWKMGKTVESVVASKRDNKPNQQSRGFSGPSKYIVPYYDNGFL